jgi:hypothetical protein
MRATELTLGNLTGEECDEYITILHFAAGARACTRRSSFCAFGVRQTLPTRRCRRRAYADGRP